MSFNGKMRKIRDNKLCYYGDKSGRIPYPRVNSRHDTFAYFKHQFKPVINFKHYEQVVNIENGLSET